DVAVRGQVRAGIGQDEPARRALGLEQRPAVVRVVLVAPRVEHRSARGDEHEHAEQHYDKSEQATDLVVQTSPPRTRPGSRRARTEMTRSSATSMKLATIELPP